MALRIRAYTEDGASPDVEDAKDLKEVKEKIRSIMQNGFYTRTGNVHSYYPGHRILHIDFKEIG